MAGVEAHAWKPVTARAYVPGIMSLLHATAWRLGATYAPLPHRFGPICEPCWLAKRRVVAVGQEIYLAGLLTYRCTHGGDLS